MFCTGQTCSTWVNSKEYSAICTRQWIGAFSVCTWTGLERSPAVLKVIFVEPISGDSIRQRSSDGFFCKGHGLYNTVQCTVQGTLDLFRTKWWIQSKLYERSSMFTNVDSNPLERKKNKVNCKPKKKPSLTFQRRNHRNNLQTHLHRPLAFSVQ